MTAKSSAGRSGSQGRWSSWSKGRILAALDLGAPVSVIEAVLVLQRETNRVEARSWKHSPEKIKRPGAPVLLGTGASPCTDFLARF